MAGGLVKYRHLSRNSAHRQALLRNLVTSLVKHESIRTTWAKAKETQRVADKLITLAKRNNETARRRAHGILFTPEELMPKLFSTLRERYLNRPGGYTRVLRTEPKSTYDQAPSAILEFVDGPKDMRFHMTAATVARDEKLGLKRTAITRLNRRKVVRFRHNGPAEFDALVTRMRDFGFGESAEEKTVRRDARIAKLKAEAEAAEAAKKAKKTNKSKPSAKVEEAAQPTEGAAEVEKKDVSVLR